MNDNQLLELIVAELRIISAEQKKIGETQAGQAVVLVEHTRRSEASEEANRQTREEMKPLQRHVAAVDLALKICGTVASLAGFILVVLTIISKSTRL